MSGPTYVSDPRIWKTFYKNMVDGNFNPRSYKGRQSGSGIAGMYSKKPYMIPVNPHITVEEPKEIFSKQVTPMVAVEERAKEDLKEEMRYNVPHVPVASIKAESAQKSHNSPTIRKKKKPIKKVYHHTLLQENVSHRSQTWILIYFVQRKQRQSIFKKYLKLCPSLVRK